jgi:hypothetical protein
MSLRLNQILGGADIRSPIFYDSNDTNYYIDAASTSVINILQFAANTAQIIGNTSSSYGSLDVRGVRNGWRGIHFNAGGNAPHLMFDGSANGGVYFETGGRWASYYSYGNNCWGFGTSTTNSAYNIYAPTGVYSGGRVDGTIFYDSNDSTYYVDPASFSLTSSIGIGGLTSSNNVQMYDSYVDASSSYLQSPPLIIRKDSSATGAIDQAPVGLFIYNLNGTNNTWTKLSMGSREAVGAGNTVSIAGLAAQKTAGTANAWATGNLHFWTKAGGTQITNMVAYSAGYVQSDYSFRSPIFYDSNDTTYYIDPAGTSRLVALWVRGSSETVGNIYVGGTAAGDRLNINYDQIWTPNGNLHLQYSGGGNIDMNYGGGFTFSRTSLRAPIFYDYNDTTYYTDPASTSNILELKTNRTWYDSSASVWGGGINMAGNNPSIGFQSTSSTWWYMLHHASSAINFYRRSTSGSWNLDGVWDSSGNFIWQGSSVRGQIFYDNNDTTYYVDPASSTISSYLKASQFVGNYKIFTINDLSASGTQARTFEIARLGIDYNDWNTVGTFEVELHEKYWSQGLKKVYNIWYGYVSNSGIKLVEWRGAGTNNFQCRIGTQVQISGDSYYLPVYVDVRNYGIVDVVIKTNRNYTTNSSPAINYSYINTAPSATNISDFTADSDLEISTLNNAKLNGNPILSSYNYTNYTLPIGGSWYGVNLPGTRWNGMTVNGGEIVFGRDLPNNGQMGILVDGCYIAGENNGFWSLSSSNDWTTRRGMYWDGTYLNFTTNSAISIFTDARSTIFYDSNNTAYYLDPASTSNLVGLTVANTITGSISGNSATTTLATKATRANGDFFIDDNYGNSVVGLYSANRYQGVFAMGNAYKLAADGTGVGTLYGIAWSHPNAGGVAANLNDHGALILLNGTYAAAISSSIRCATDMRTPIYYDSNNTVYYCDPASTSNLNAITAAGNITAAQYYTGGWFRNNGSGNGLYNESTGQHFYSDSANYWNVASSAGAQGIRLRTGGHNGTVRGYFYADTNNDVGFLNQDGSWRLRVVGGDYALADGSSMRAQIFYDSNDTSYYVDAASTSVLNRVNYQQLRRNFGASVYSGPPSGSNIVKTFSGVLVAGSANGSTNTYTVIETSIPQGNYQMGGFTIKWFENYSSTNAKTTIEIAGYWNPTSNGGFIGFEFTSSNPNVQPTIQVGANASGNTVFILTHYSSSYPVIVARDLWFGYNSSDAEYGTGWTMTNTNSLAAYSNIVSATLRVGPTLTGTGASGTWGISITGSSASCTGNSATATTASSCSGNSATATTATNAGCVTSDTGNVGDSRLQYWQTSGNTTLNPDTEWYNAIRMGHGNPVTYYSNTLAVKMTGSNLGDIYTRTTTNGTAGTWNRFWNNNNDGAGSGLDADLLDGINSASFLRSDVSATNSVDLRSPIYYDSDNTTYYINAGGISNLLGLTVVNTITGNISGNAGTVSAGVYTNTNQNITGEKYFQSNLGTTSGSLSSPPLQVYSTGTNAAFMSFHRAGNYAVNMGLDSDNVLRIGGWSASANRLQLDMSGNLTLAGVVDATQFRDSANTAYYVDPASTSILNLVRTRNTFGERATVTSAASTTIDTNFNVTELTMSASITTLTLSNIQASTIVHMWTIVTVGNGTAYSITWPAAIKWPGGTAPTITSTNAKRDIYQFVTYDGGTNIYAIIVGQNL